MAAELGVVPDEALTQLAPLRRGLAKHPVLGVGEGLGEERRNLVERA